MTDLDNLRDLLDRAGWHQADQAVDDTAYVIRLASPTEDCADCATELLATGQWTGEFSALFAADGTIRQVWISGD